VLCNRLVLNFTYLTYMENIQHWMVMNLRIPHKTRSFWHLYVLALVHYRMTLRTAKSDRDIRTCSTGFRVDLGTRYVTICSVSLVAGRSGGKRYTMRRMERGLWAGGGDRETVYRKRKLSAVFLQPIQNPSYMSHVLLLCISFWRLYV
jgi:hypothetical protein